MQVDRLSTCYLTCYISSLNQMKCTKPLDLELNENNKLLSYSIFEGGVIAKAYFIFVAWSEADTIHVVF